MATTIQAVAISRPRVEYFSPWPDGPAAELGLSSEGNLRRCCEGEVGLETLSPSKPDGGGRRSAAGSCVEALARSEACRICAVATETASSAEARATDMVLLNSLIGAWLAMGLPGVACGGYMVLLDSSSASALLAAEISSVWRCFMSDEASADVRLESGVFCRSSEAPRWGGISWNISHPALVLQSILRGSPHTRWDNAFRSLASCCV